MAWFLQKYSQIIATTGLAGVITATFLPQTLGLDYYRSLLANYQRGEEKPVNEHVTGLWNKVLARAKLTAEDEAGVQIFTCFGNDPISKGSAFLKTGAIVGVPPTFYYTSVDDIDRELLQANRRYVDWDSPAAKQLSQSVVLSDKAKAFGMARELMMSSSYHIYIDGAMQSMFYLAAYTTAYAMNRRLMLRQRMKVWGRMGLYGVLGISAYCMYTMLSDTYFCYRDNSADRRAAKMGWAYAEGGVEFYTKALQRNKALREIMGAEGAATYTVHGNDVYTIRRPRVQLTERKRALDKFFMEFQEQEEAREKSAAQAQAES